MAMGCSVRAKTGTATGTVQSARKSTDPTKAGRSAEIATTARPSGMAASDG
jgi:hypothetical protein